MSGILDELRTYVEGELEFHEARTDRRHEDYDEDTSYVHVRKGEALRGVLDVLNRARVPSCTQELTERPGRAHVCALGMQDALSALSDTLTHVEALLVHARTCWDEEKRARKMDAESWTETFQDMRAQRALDLSMIERQANEVSRLQGEIERGNDLLRDSERALRALMEGRR